MKPKFKGTGIAMLTPFNMQGDVDFDRLSILTDFLINNGVNYLVALGTTSENPTLSKQEKEDIVKCIVDANGNRVPVVVGVGGNNTAEVTAEIRRMDNSAVSGLLSVAPYYNKPGQEGLYQHFSSIAAVSELPVILYNVPLRTGSNISSGTALRLAHDYQDTIVAIKEASGNFTQIMEIITRRPEGFMVLSGDDALALPMISIGGDGVISVIGNAYPAQFSEMIASALNGSYNKAREIHHALFPMISAIFREGNPCGVKACLSIQGYIENVLRLPLIPASENLCHEIEELDKAIRNP